MSSREIRNGLVNLAFPLQQITVLKKEVKRLFRIDLQQCADYFLVLPLDYFVELEGISAFHLKTDFEMLLSFSFLQIQLSFHLEQTLLLEVFALSFQFLVYVVANLREHDLVRFQVVDALDESLHRQLIS